MITPIVMENIKSSIEEIKGPIVLKELKEKLFSDFKTKISCSNLRLILKDKFRMTYKKVYKVDARVNYVASK